MSLFLSCLKIFFCRILDVSLGTVRTMLTVREKTFLAAVIGFIEVFLWYIVVKDAISGNMPVIPTAIAYAGGFAAGTYIGGTLSRKLITGNVSIRIITSGRDDLLLSEIRKKGYAITVVNVNESEYGDAKYLVYADVDKKKTKDFVELVKQHDPGAFILVQDTRSHIGGYYGEK